MKKLQVFFYAILLFSGMMMSCIQSPSGGGDPSPQTPATVKFVVTDEAGDDCTVIDNGTEHSVTISTAKASFQVITGGNVDVKIDGIATKAKELTFTTNGDEQTLSVEIKLRGKTETHTVKIRYYAGAVKKITVQDNNGKDARVNRRKDVYTASVPTDKATVTVETYDAADSVKIDGTEITVTPKSKTLEFTGSETVKKLKISVTHAGVEENYMLSVYYSDPTKMPSDAYLTAIKIIRTDTNAVVALSPAFDKDNTTYTASVPAAVDKIKIEAEADAGIVIEGTGEHSLNAGENKVTVKAKPVSDPFYELSYTITVRRAAAGASANADLASLNLEAKYMGIKKERNWITAPAAFSSSVTEYEGTVNAVVDEFWIKAKPAETGSTMTVSVNGGLPQGLGHDAEQQFKLLMQPLNVFVIAVTAPDGAAVKTYTVKVNRQKGSFVLKTFSGTGLNNFYAGKFENYKKSGNFGTKYFTATVAKTQNQTTITAEPEYPDSTTMKIQINDDAEEDFSGTKVVDLTQEKTGSPGWIYVNIRLISSSAGGSENTYRLQIKKVDQVAGDSNAKLKALNVLYYGGQYKFYQIALNETFASDKTDYTLTLPEYVSEIRVEAVPDSNKAYIDGWLGQKVNGFDAPFDEVKIPVVAENGNRKEYKITINVLSPPTITIDSPTENETVNVAALSSGYEVTGSFTDPRGIVNEIWVGSSGLPIQEKNNGKWVKATVTGHTFRALVPSLNELPNGERDVKVGAFAISGQTLAVKRVPIKITGSSVPFASLTVTVKNPDAYMMPAGAVMSVLVSDENQWQKSEDVILGNKTVSSIAGNRFPMSIGLKGIKAQGTVCRVDVQVYERVGNKDVLKYYGVVKSTVATGQSNTCEVDLKIAQ
ncbi:hypothetical protein HMPREF1221_01557 [Treponema socranskii subsp. paredis ATCC 35535]|nr:hypothetical protein HMPREF1221_01557 [Treponema socranskii subsp. paredis ATCC 35535]